MHCKYIKDQIRYEHQIIPGMLITEVYFAHDPKKIFSQTFKVDHIEEHAGFRPKSKFIHYLRHSFHNDQLCSDYISLADHNVHPYGGYNDNFFRYPTIQEIIAFNKRNNQNVNDSSN
jgi:hypothetical protein